MLNGIGNTVVPAQGAAASTQLAKAVEHAHSAVRHLLVFKGFSMLELHRWSVLCCKQLAAPLCHGQGRLCHSAVCMLASLSPDLQTSMLRRVCNGICLSEMLATRELQLISMPPLAAGRSTNMSFGLKAEHDAA